MRSSPLLSNDAAIPQQPQAPVGAFQAGSSAENVLPLSFDRAIQTWRPASPAGAPGAFPCQATTTWPAEWAATVPHPSRPNVRVIKLRSGSNAVCALFIRLYSIGSPGLPDSGLITVLNP